MGIREILKPHLCHYEKMECNICSNPCGISQAEQEILARVPSAKEILNIICDWTEENDLETSADMECRLADLIHDDIIKRLGE